MRNLLIGFAWIILASSFLPAQFQPGFQIGGMTGYDYGVGLPSTGRFQPYGKGQVGMMNFEMFVAIPFGPLSLYPSSSYGISLKLHPVSDAQGAYIPWGYVHHQPASSQPMTYVWSPEYSDVNAVADMDQTLIGSYALLHAGAGFELGSGLFYRRKRATVTTFQYSDAYYFSGSDGVQDTYLYDDSWSEGMTEHRVIKRSLALPLVMQWRYCGELAFCGTNFTYWLGGGDTYFSFKSFFGVNF